MHGHKRSGIYNSLSVYLSPYEPGNAAFDWFVEPNELGEVTDYRGRKATRDAKLSDATTERIQYTVEIPGHGSVWNLELWRGRFGSRVPLSADHADAEQRARLVIDASMAYDEA